MSVIKELDQGFETVMTRQNLEDLLSGAIEANVRLYQWNEEGACYLDGKGQKPGEYVTQNINVSDVEAFKKGQFKDFAQVAMIPAVMSRKQRIRSLEQTAGDRGLTDAVRHKAWDDAGKLKATHKEQAKMRREVIEGGAEVLAKAGKKAKEAIEKWQKNGGRDE